MQHVMCSLKWYLVQELSTMWLGCLCRQVFFLEMLFWMLLGFTATCFFFQKWWLYVCGSDCDVCITKLKPSLRRSGHPSKCFHIAFVGEGSLILNCSTKRHRGTLDKYECCVIWIPWCFSWASRNCNDGRSARGWMCFSSKYLKEVCHGCVSDGFSLQPPPPHTTSTLLS